MRRHTLLLCALFLHPAAALPADTTSKFAMKGAGLLPCQVFASERKKQSNVYYMIGGWVEGYLAAYNRLSPDTYDILSFESLEMLLVVMNNHCQSNPNDRLHAVVDAIVTQLAPDRIRQESPLVEIVDGDRRTRLYRETIRRIQAALNTRGLYKGAIDGRYTDATRTALAAFQSDADFEKTGFPDQATLWRLLRK
jgi:hypothetical protein